MAAWTSGKRECARQPFARSAAERGQTLLFALVAMVVLTVAIFVLFDLQSTIHYKVKAQSATDAAALAAARWQKDSLNIIGELNLVKACTVLITDPDYGVNGNIATFMKDDGTYANANSEAYARIQNEIQQLKEASAMLTQMQARVSFVGPLIALGAAQQAAKNNGLSYNKKYSDYAYLHYTEVCDNALYGDSVLRQYVPYYAGATEQLGYQWRASDGSGGAYGKMLRDLLQIQSGANGANGVQAMGFAVNPNKKFIGQPTLYYDDGTGSADATKNSIAYYLSQKWVYDAILARNYCALRDFLRLLAGSDLSGLYNNLKIDRSANSFPYESEYLPLQVSFMPTSFSDYYSSYYSTPYSNAADSTSALSSIIEKKNSNLTLLKDVFTDNADPYLRTTDGAIVPNWLGTDTDSRFAAIPRITWCTYDQGSDYGNWRRWDGETQYIDDDSLVFFRGTVKEGYNYKSGAYAFMGAPFPAQGLWMTGNWSRSDSVTDKSPYLGDTTLFNGRFHSYGKHLKESEERYRDYMNGNYEDIFSVSSVAKPLGRIDLDGGSHLNPVKATMVLPVFDKVALIPLSFPDFSDSNEGPPGADPFDDFYYFVVYYMPYLGRGNSLSNIYAPYTSERFHAALEALTPSFVSAGIAWLDTMNYETITNADGSKVNVPTHTNEYYCTYWQRGGPGTRYGPSVAH